ncbi:hypothetical protein Tco_0788288 [Tanacetum coccineum]
MEVSRDADRIKSAASKLGCLVLNTPFLYLGTKVGENMSRVHAWKSSFGNPRIGVEEFQLDNSLQVGSTINHSSSAVDYLKSLTFASSEGKVLALQPWRMSLFFWVTNLSQPRSVGWIVRQIMIMPVLQKNSEINIQKGSLGDVLYGVGAVLGLHWGTRLNIAHGIAFALAYVPNDGLTFWGYEWDTHDTCFESVLDQHVQVKPRRNFKAYSGGIMNTADSGSIAD